MENRYDKYKDSGIAWIGEIPEHWVIGRIKNIIHAYKAGPFGSSLITSNLNNIGKYLIYTPEHIAASTTNLDSNLYLPDYRINEMGQFEVGIGDIVFPIVGTLGRAMQITSDMPNGIINQRLSKFRLFENIICSNYFMWIFGKSDFYKIYIDMNSRGSFILNLTKLLIGNMPIMLPSLPEQQSIATYLDQKCGEIDELIILQEEMITKLQSYKQSVITEAVTKGLDKNVPLKDSGIEWIGEIPEHWSVVKIKYLAKIKSGDSISSNEIIQEGIYEVYGGNGLMGFCNKKNVDGVNIIIGRVGALCGNVRLISESKFITDNALILNCFNNALYSYMYIMLKAANLNNLNTSNAQPLITGSKVLNVSLPIPSLSEQQSIADYLDQKCSEIDELISIKQQKIEKLKDYKKSLIFECVTGKRKVS